jgi:glutaredoxin
MVSMLILYSTDHCTLCEQALDWLFSMPELNGRALRVVDVADDDDLLARFGERLPVLEVDGAEMTWPFDVTALRRLLNR